MFWTKKEPEISYPNEMTYPELSGRQAKIETKADELQKEQSLMQQSLLQIIDNMNVLENKLSALIKNQATLDKYKEEALAKGKTEADMIELIKNKIKENEGSIEANKTKTTELEFKMGKANETISDRLEVLENSVSGLNFKIQAIIEKENVKKELTAAQQNIYDMAKQGLSQQNIADKLGITQPGVASQYNAIRRKGWDI